MTLLRSRVDWLLWLHPAALSTSCFFSNCIDSGHSWQSGPYTLPDSFRVRRDLNTPHSEIWTRLQWWTGVIRVLRVFIHQTTLSGRPSQGWSDLGLCSSSTPKISITDPQPPGVFFSGLQDVLGGVSCFQSSYTEESKHSLELRPHKTSAPNYDWFTAGFPAFALALCNEYLVLSRLLYCWKQQIGKIESMLS